MSRLVSGRGAIAARRSRNSSGFLLADLAIGVTLVLARQALRGRFVSLYVLNDVMLPVLSLLQALVLPVVVGPAGATFPPGYLTGGRGEI